MSGSQPGSGDASSEEAVWRDLIARYDMAMDLDAAAPWPDIESLGARPPGPEQDRPGQQQSGQQHPDQDQPDQDQPGQPRRGQVPRDTGSSPASLGGATYTVGLPVPPVGQDAGPAGSEPGAAPAGPGAGPGAESGTGSSSGPGNGPVPERQGSDRDEPASGSTGGPGADRTRVIRHATAPASRSPAEDDHFDEDEHYVPPPPPPLPHLDPVAKGAWTALFGGPAYLLVASVAGWVVPGWAALAAVAAFVGGFTAVVLRLGDRPAQDDDPDNGAVL